MILGLCVVTVAASMLAAVRSWPLLLAFRGLHGMGAACLFATQQAILADIFPPERRGTAIGTTVAAVYFGGAMGPVIGGFIVHYLGWRRIFVFIAALAVAATAVSIAKLPRRVKRPGDVSMSGVSVSELDLPGMALYTSMSLCLTYGLTSISDVWFAKYIALLGVALLLTFIWRETKATSPVVKPSLFKNGPNFLLSNLSALLNYAATFAIAYLVSIYLQQVKGLDADMAGLVLIASPCFQVVLSPVAGRLSDRCSAFIPASSGMAVCTVCLGALAFIGRETPLPVLLGILAMTGGGFAFFSAPNTKAIMSEAPREDFGIASSIVGIMRQFGMVIGMAVIMSVFRLFLGEQTIAAAPIPNVLRSIHACFAVFCLIGAAGVFTSLNRRQRKTG